MPPANEAGGISSNNHNSKVMEDQQLSQKGARAYVNKALHNLCEEAVDSDYGNMVSEAVAIEAVMIALRATTVPVVGEAQIKAYTTLRNHVITSATYLSNLIDEGELADFEADIYTEWKRLSDALLASPSELEFSASPTLEGREEKEEVDYSDPQVQYKLACEAERRLRLRGHISDSAAAIIRVKIQKRLDKDLEKGGQDAS